MKKIEYLPLFLLSLILLLAVSCDAPTGGKTEPAVYTVSFTTDDAVTIYAAQTVTAPAQYIDSLPADPVQTGYYFQGWYTQPGGTGDVFSLTTVVDRDLLVYARWSAIPVYAVAFDTHGGSAVDTQYIAESGLAAAPADPEKPGSVFLGWYRNEACTIPWNFGSDTVTAAVTIHAGWDPLSFTVRFHPNGGSGTMSDLTVDSGETETLPASTLSCLGYNFTGWATETAGSVVYTDADDLTMGAADMDLYAVWVWNPATTLADLAAGGIPTMVDMRTAVGQPLLKHGPYWYLPSFTGAEYYQTTETGGSFQNDILPFTISTCEVTYELWWIVRLWGENNGYEFSLNGSQGPSGPITDPPEAAYMNQPVARVTWRVAIVWCNAYSEMSGLTPCYTSSGSVLRNGTYDNRTALDAAVCDWSADGFRLPTEGEWQYAASGAGRYPQDYASGAVTSYSDTGDQGGYSGGVWTSGSNGIPDGRETNNAVAVYADNPDVTSTSPSGSRLPNVFGLYDMSGNVSEWCWDWFGDLPTSEQRDYHGPGSGTLRTYRGGAWWITQGWYLTVGKQASVDPGYTSAISGFRVVKKP